MEKNGKKWKLFLLLIIVYPYKNSSQMSNLENFWKNFWPLYEKKLNAFDESNAAVF